MSSDNRRSTVRRQAELPFDWRPMSRDPDPHAPARALSLPPTIALQADLADADARIERAVGGLDDRAAADAVRALADKVSLVADAVLAGIPVPPIRPVTLSAEGVGFLDGQPVDEGSIIAIHLILPPGRHVVCAAEVTRCLAADAEWRIGATFRDLDAATARALTRFTIQRNGG